MPEGFVRALSKFARSVSSAVVWTSLFTLILATPGRSSETAIEALADYECSKSLQGRPLDLSGARVTFEDEFDRISVTGPTGGGPWFAPVHGGFGGAKFLPPHPQLGPFSVRDGALTIRMEKRGDQWYSGLMQTVNAAGSGFTQRYGYFEMKAKFPRGQGVWTAFWLKTVNQYTDPSQTRAEIDVVEAYGGNDWNGHHAAVHLWPANVRQPSQLQKHWFKGCYNRVSGNMFDREWHTYTAEVNPEWVIFYYDRKELARFRSLPEFRKPLFLLVDLALLPKEAEGAQPAEMNVDYVRVWQRPEWMGAR